MNYRELFLVVPSGRTVVVAQPDDRLNLIDLRLVTDIEMRPSPRAGESNGSGEPP